MARSTPSTKSGFCQFHGQFVDLRREDEIVLRESSNGVGPDLDRQVAVSDQVQVRVMSFGLGDFGHRLEKFDSRDEILHPPLATNANPVRAQGPPGDVFEKRLGLLASQLRHASFAGNALFLSQLYGGEDIHFIDPNRNQSVVSVLPN